MKASAPKESKAQKAARQAEEARVAQERLRAENARIEETQDDLQVDTLARIRRRGRLSLASGAQGGSSLGGTTLPAATGNGLTNSLFSPLVLKPAKGGGSGSILGGGGSRGASSLVALV